MTNPVALYDFTSPEVDLDEFKRGLRSVFKKWAFQLEEGDTGYMHYQGRGSLFKKRRLNEAAKLCREVGLSLHLTPTTNNALAEGNQYHLKADTRRDGPWTSTDEEVFIPRQYKGLVDNLLPWQQKVWDSADVHDPRTINYVYDVHGNNGKSTIASLMDLYDRGIDLPPMNDAEKLIQSTADILMAKACRDPKVIFIDMPRAMDKRKLGGLYTAIEQIKKGKVYDTRYTYKSWWFDSPQIWVFANIIPDLDYLSKDRWKLWQICLTNLVPFVP